jgi:selenocysteine-specific elongation factor
VGGGVVALTKTDLIEDTEWFDLITEDIRSALMGTVLAQAPIVRVSSRTRQGIPELLQAIQTCLADRSPRPDLGRPRLPVDRVFTMAGFGTVVTGTLSDGTLRLGDEIEVLPAGLRGRVRGLQTHKVKEDHAVPGSRTAVNISGINVDQISRGAVIAHPGDYSPTRRLDVRFKLLRDINRPLEHNTEVKIFLGTAEVLGRVRLLGSDQLLPGEVGWLQLELTESIIAVRGDRYILRRPSPGETLGGGEVIDPQPRGRHKRFAQDVLQRLEVLAHGEPADIFMQALLALGAAPLSDVLERSHLEAQVAEMTFSELVQRGQVLCLDPVHEDGKMPSNPMVIGSSTWNNLADRAIQEVRSYHQLYPLRRGIPREELKSRLKLTSGGQGGRLFSALMRKLVTDNQLQEGGPVVFLPGHKIKYNPQEQRKVDALLSRFEAAPFSPPSTKECLLEVGEDIYTALLDTGELIALTPEVVFRNKDYEKMVADVRQLLISRGTLTAAEARDHFNTSRKYILALLEHLDAIGVTVREGDIRRLKK